MRFLLFLFVLAGCCVNTGLPGEAFLGAPYVASPLGEGVAPDSDPLIRFDAFDCVTFVETVLAGGDVDALNQIRYKNGNVDFVARNHFIESDWLVNNANLVENVSRNFAETKIKHVVIDKAAWFKKVHNLDTDFVPVAVGLEYIPYEKLGRIDSRETLIVLFVADNQKNRDKIGTDLAVVHMGLLLPNGMLRHASSDKKCVTDVSFQEYIAARAMVKTNLGIVLVKIK
ncbi:MAG: DUF1460 domain-containing protein [Alphaproteobacteria bacterium]|nr:DUF1460 domain-containing protein [Alphaproteobacteria bacterium]